MLKKQFLNLQIIKKNKKTKFRFFNKFSTNNNKILLLKKINTINKIKTKILNNIICKHQNQCKCPNKKRNKK